MQHSRIILLEQHYFLDNQLRLSYIRLKLKRLHIKEIDGVRQSHFGHVVIRFDPRLLYRDWPRGEVKKGGGKSNCFRRVPRIGIRTIGNLGLLRS